MNNIEVTKMIKEIKSEEIIKLKTERVFKRSFELINYKIDQLEHEINLLYRVTRMSIEKSEKYSNFNCCKRCQIFHLIKK